MVTVYAVMYRRLDTKPWEIEAWEDDRREAKVIRSNLMKETKYGADNVKVRSLTMEPTASGIAKELNKFTGKFWTELTAKKSVE